MMNNVQAEANDVVTSIFFVKFTLAYVLFDSGATNSFVSSIFVNKVGLVPTSEIRIAVKTPTCSVLACKYVHKDVPIHINRVNFLENLF